MTKKSMEFIAPLRVAFAIDGREVEISPVVLAELPELLRATAPIFAALPTFDDAMLLRLKAGRPTVDDLATLSTMLMLSGSSLVDVLVICSRQPAEWVGKLLPDRAAQLAAVCLEVNADFFMRAMPGLRTLASRLGALLATTKPSSSS